MQLSNTKIKNSLLISQTFQLTWFIFVLIYVPIAQKPAFSYAARMGSLFYNEQFKTVL